MKEAIILGATEGETTARNLRRLLAFFGVGSQLEIAAGCGGRLLADQDHGTNVKLLGSAESVLRLLETLESTEGGKEWWGRCIHSVFVCNDGPIEMALALLRKIAKDGNVSVERAKAVDFRVSNESRDFCGPMCGVGCSTRGNNEVDVLKAEKSEGIISCAAGPVFAKLTYKDVPIFFSTAAIIDIDSDLETRDFDLRDHFLPAACIVMYVKWAFSETCFQPDETSACLVIDDPPLKPRYGFVDFKHLNELMWSHHFSCSLAFIPWNWRRSDSRVVRLFKENPERLSLSVHGCDHTRREFGTQDSDQLRWKVLCASQRMSRHEFRTGLHHDPVMVFPQGVFSSTAMSTLKSTEFIGVVNSKVFATDPAPRPIRISDVWDVAVMNYNNFPIFTRRYPWQGLENFAFDILLGKPCIAVVHHNDCHDKCRHVVEFIDRLNQLNARLIWRDLGGLVRRSFRRRKLSSNVLEIEMFGKEVLLENTSSETRHFSIRRRESCTEQIEQIRAGIKPVDWISSTDGISFLMELKPGQSQLVKTVFQESQGNGFAPENAFAGAGVVRWARATLRRYLCEIRDNYVMGKTFSKDGDRGNGLSSNHLPGGGLPATAGRI